MQLRIRLHFMLAAFALTAMAQNRPGESDVPAVPSAPEVVSAIIQLSQLNRQKLLVDLGCGDGRIAVAAAKSAARAICVENDSDMLGRARRTATAAGLLHQIEFRQVDLRDFVRDGINLAQVDVVVVYLTAELNRQIAADLERNLKRGGIVISHAYPISGWKPREIKPVRIQSTGNTSRLYVYEPNPRNR
ncbi:MAG: class I SAM-dependent methyltransferase [Acidobacteria bacterium]|nr:class I SAM-dependent methyltransferase [Acidobacteriota bacterium]